MTFRIVALLALACCGCGSVPPDRAAEFQTLQGEVAAAEAAVQVAEATLDPTDDMVASQRLANAELAMAKFETEVVRDRIGTVATAVSSIPGVGPIATTVGSLAAIAAPVIALISKRQRKHLANAIKSSVRNPADAAKSIGKAYGLAHSNEASKAAAGDAT